jgi:hypothetical protein
MVLTLGVESLPGTCSNYAKYGNGPELGPEKNIQKRYGKEKREAEQK